MTPVSRSVFDPVFVLGYKRSGTTMFRLMLNGHPGLAIPPESEYFQKIPPALGTRNHPRLKIDHIALKLHKMRRCDFHLKLSFEQIRQILDAILPATTPEIIAALYRHWGYVQGKNSFRWGDKKPQHWQMVYRLKNWYPEGQFISIIRDPRDVYASVEEHFPEQIVGRAIIRPHIITAWQWRMANREIARQGQMLGRERYFSVQYEKLVKDPTYYCKKCCAFLGISYTDRMLEFQRAAKNPTVQGAASNGGAHRQTTREINPGQIGRFRKSLLKEEMIGDIEYICRDLFDAYDWPPSGIQLKRNRKAVLRTFCEFLNIAWKCRRGIKRIRGAI